MPHWPGSTKDQEITPHLPCVPHHLSQQPVARKETLFPEASEGLAHSGGLQ